MRLRLAALAIAALAAVTPVHAAGLSGMGANIFGNFFGFKTPNLDTQPVKSIKAGKLAIVLQTTRLADLRKAFGGTIQSSGDATWLCYHSGDTNTWFISNALGGEEFVMMVALETSTRTPADCEEASEGFAVPVFDVPSLGASTDDIKARFGVASGGSKISFRADRAGGYTDIAQYLGYRLRGGKVVGIGVGETSVPTAH